MLDTAHYCLEHHAGWLVLLAGVLLIAMAFLAHHWDHGIWPFCIAISIFLLSSILLFTRPLVVEADCNTMFRFAWVYVAGVLIFGAIVLSGIPFKGGANVGIPIDEAGNPEYPNTYLIAVVRGCDFDAIPSSTSNASFNGSRTPSGNTAAPSPTSTSKETAPAPGSNALSLLGVEPRPPNSGMPVGFHCGDLAPQWLITIGGTILSCSFDGTCPRPAYGPPPKVSASRQQKDIDALEKQLSAAMARQKAAADGVRAHDNIARLGMRADFAPNVEGLTADRDSARKEIDEVKKKIRTAQSALASADGWDTAARNLQGAPIVGGVSVPVYFVILAWIGGLIGMMRKLPEFQERVSPNYPNEYQERVAAGTTPPPLPPLTPNAARDLLVFQILQSLAAPALAIVAFSYARPEQVTTTVLLAFIAGFSSEVILVAVRETVDRLIGLGPRTSRARAAPEPAPATQNVPPRGPVAPNPAPPTASGGFKIGDRVTLAKPVGIFLPGSQGVVLQIDANGDLIVRVTQDHTGMPVDFRLQAQGPDAFRHATDTSAPAEGPVG